MKDELFTTLEAAKLLDVAEVTMKRWRAEGGGPPFVRIGNKQRRIMYRKQDIAKFCREYNGFDPFTKEVTV